MRSLELINPFLSALYSRQPMSALPFLEKQKDSEIDALSLAMLRTAIQVSGQSALYYRQLANCWDKLQNPALKPNVTHSDTLLISDSTLSGLPGFLKLFSSVYGVSLNIRLSEYDSVEQQVLSKDNLLNIQGSDIIVLILSEQWIRRYLGSTTLIEQKKISELKELLNTMFDALRARKPAKILVGNFPSRSYIGPGGTLITPHYLGWSNVITHLNDWLKTKTSDDLYIVDIAESISLAGGNRALGRLSYLRARIPFEESGLIAVCREIATSVANILGKNHRALLTDWDNTLWGGEVGELGLLGVNCNVDNADGLGYQLFQTYIRDLQKLGILIAAVSRNNPSVVQILEKNSDVLLKKGDFSSIQIHWGSKSDSVSQVIKDLGFGSEFMVFVDDSPAELVEVLSVHPYIDLIQAGPTPDSTLARLCDGRYFNMVSILESDLERHHRQTIIRQQTELQGAFNSSEDFLRSLQIQLTVETLNTDNEMRVVQLLQKTNQFNLTTRRHQLNDLYQLKNTGAKFGVFSYEDNFGSQGIISVVILRSNEDKILIDTWLMSCRVLNRCIEDAVFNWIVHSVDQKQIIGEYIPTPKNALVQDLFHRFKFKAMQSISGTEGQTQWIFNPKEIPPPNLFIKMLDRCQQAEVI